MLWILSQNYIVYIIYHENLLLIIIISVTDNMYEMITEAPPTLPHKRKLEVSNGYNFNILAILQQHDDDDEAIAVKGLKSDTLQQQQLLS